MDRRYRLLAAAGVRNIKGYNKLTVEKQPDLFGSAGAEPLAPLPERLPYVVIVVDELADLMLSAQAEMENYIARLAQLSRAVGIHMILATQRPSVNVITGTIKANFPARIAFRVAQKVESRTILDASGAEVLLGRGDMLYQPSGTGKLMRLQGALTTEEDVGRLADFLRRRAPPPGAGGSALETMLAKPAPVGGLDGIDEGLVEQAVEVIRATHRATASGLQRRLRIGYTRAARLMDILELRGIVGPAVGTEPREILIDLDG